MFALSVLTSVLESKSQRHGTHGTITLTTGGSRVVGGEAAYGSNEDGTHG